MKSPNSIALYWMSISARTFLPWYLLDFEQITDDIYGPVEDGRKDEDEDEGRERDLGKEPRRVEDEQEDERPRHEVILVGDRPLRPRSFPNLRLKKLFTRSPRSAPTASRDDGKQCLMGKKDQAVRARMPRSGRARSRSRQGYRRRAPAMFSRRRISAARRNNSSRDPPGSLRQEARLPGWEDRQGA